MIGKREDKKVLSVNENSKEMALPAEDWNSKNGVTNKAFETDEKIDTNVTKRPENNVNVNTIGDNKDLGDQSQIEIGFTESMICTSKL